MSSFQVEFLRHILDECVYVGEKADGLTKQEFMQDATLRRAFVRSIEIIGEATKQVPSTVRRKYSQVQWKVMAGM